MVDVNDNLKKLSFKKFDFSFRVSVHYGIIQVVNLRKIRVQN